MPLNGTLCGVAMLALIAVAPTARAQARGRGAAAPASQAKPVELGIDGGMVFGLSDPKSTSIALPLQDFRAGFMLDEQMELEPFGAFNYFSQGGSSTTMLGIGTGLLYHFSPIRSQPQVYVRPLAQLSFLSVNPGGGRGSSSTTQFGIGIGLGMKHPISDRLSWRYEVNLTHAFQSGAAPSQTNLGLLGGLSFFTH